MHDAGLDAMLMPEGDAPRPPDARVPTFEELGLTREVEALRERLAAAEAEIERLTGSPVAAPKAWLRRKLDRGRSR